MQADGLVGTAKYDEMPLLIASTRYLHEHLGDIGRDW